MAHHTYTLNLTWTGNLGEGTSTYRSYSRGHTIQIPGKPLLLGSADPAFRGDPTYHNPEELFVSALAACHMLWYLHLCAEAGVIVVRYTDSPVGIMQETITGAHFSQVTLKPTVARALANEPKILLLDEPFGALDAQTKEVMQGFLLDVWRRTGTTILMITHDVEEAVFISQRVYVLSSSPGRVKQEVAVQLSPDRDYTCKRTLSFLQQKEELLDLLRAEVKV